MDDRQATSSKDKEIEGTYLYQQIMKKLDNGWVQQQIIDDIVNQLVEQVKKDINVDHLVKEFQTPLILKKLQNEIINVIKEHMRKEQ